MEALIAAFRLLALSQVLLFSIVVLFSANSLRMRSVLCGLGLTVQAYLLAPLLLAAGYTSTAMFVGVLAAFCPLLLLLAVEELFEDGRRIGLWSAVGLAYVAVVLWHQVWPPSMPGQVFTHHAAQGIRIVLVVLALTLLWRGRSNDLIELRLRARILLLLAIGVTSLAVLIIEAAFSWRVPGSIEAPGMLAIALLATGANLAFWRYNPRFDFSSPHLHAPPPTERERLPPSASADPMLVSLQQLMERERLYADHDLRIAGVAALLNVPEYRLRRVINQTLGYRNFNRYINDYRVREACVRLLSQPDLPVLSIALDVGFRSISSFNSAFREVNGCSPSEFRENQRAGN